jgi:hypothetical protein
MEPVVVESQLVAQQQSLLHLAVCCPKGPLQLAQEGESSFVVAGPGALQSLL